MIYVCIGTKNHSRSVGLLLWKIRKVFDEFPREYQVLVADDASDDGTPETLESYHGALPMTLECSTSARGYAATMEHLLRSAVARTDRPRRDLAITLPADYRTSPAIIPRLVRSFESGADVVVAESPVARSFGEKLLRRTAPFLLRPGMRVPGLEDVTSGVAGFRLVTLKSCFRDSNGELLVTEGSCADAELVARTAAHARQWSAITIDDEVPAASIVQRENTLALALNLFRAGRRVRIPAPQAPLQRA